MRWRPRAGCSRPESSSSRGRLDGAAGHDDEPGVHRVDLTVRVHVLDAVARRPSVMMRLT